MPESIFSGAQARAWPIIEAGVSEGMSASQALSEYRSGGGHIRTQDWYRAYRMYEGSSKEWERLTYIKNTDSVPASMFGESPYNFAQRYVVQYKAYITNADTGEREQVYRQVESDRLLTWTEWQDAMKKNLIEDVSSPAQDVSFISEIHFFERQGHSE